MISRRLKIVMEYGALIARSLATHTKNARNFMESLKVVNGDRKEITHKTMDKSTLL